MTHNRSHNLYLAIRDMKNAADAEDKLINALGRAWREGYSAAEIDANSETVRQALGDLEPYPRARNPYRTRRRVWR